MGEQKKPDILVKCRTCRDTGVWETGNNDHPCPDCPKGSTAVFNCCTPSGLKKLTGEQIRRGEDRI